VFEVKNTTKKPLLDDYHLSVNANVFWQAWEEVLVPAIETCPAGTWLELYTEQHTAGTLLFTPVFTSIWNPIELVWASLKLHAQSGSAHWEEKVAHGRDLSDQAWPGSVKHVNKLVTTYLNSTSRVTVQCNKEQAEIK